MANTDKISTVSPQLSGKEGHGPLEEISGRGGEGLGGGAAGADGATTSVVIEASDVPEASAPTAAADSKPSSNPTRPSLVQLGQGTSTTPSQPKRFSAVNINKKFLEKNSTTSGPSPTSSGSTVAKTGSPISRPQAQPSPSHSRLVTTKLTSTSPASSTSGAGWSRPSSAAPPNAVGSQSPNSSSPLLPTATASANPGAALQHAGKLLQPQPRTVVTQQSSLNKDIGAGSNKPAWGNVKSTTLSQRGPIRQNDFPTAAEVAQVATSARIAKLNDSREAAETAAANKQARMEEADTFRGVHLDPNAHHWDEMAEDDDNFLDGVIEFGDGRQYKIESTDVHSDSPQLSDSFSSSPQVTSKAKSRLDDISPLKDPASSIPVSKEERFADDFDRSWPRSRTSPALPTRDFPPASAAPPPVSPIVSQTQHSPQEASRVLFNERSNRLEPYSNSHRPGISQHPAKRGGHQEFSVSPTEARSARDFALLSPSQNPIQLLQKPGGADFPPRSRRFSGGSSGAGPSNAHPRDRDRDQPIRRDAPPPSPRMSRDNYNGGIGKDGNFNVERGRRSDMGPPPLPPHSMRGPSREGGRQLPPHLSPMPQNATLPQVRRSSRDSRFPPHSASGEFTIPPQSARRPSQSPALSHTSAARISPTVAISLLPQLSAPELDVVRKDVMQNAAARAKQRRQQEEEEREKEKERARRKAAELEERMKAAEAEKLKMKEAQEEAEKLAKAQEDAAIAVIEEAIKSVEVAKPMLGAVTAPLSQPSVRPETRRPPPLTDVSIQPQDTGLLSGARRTSTSAPVGVAAISPPAENTESWRSKASPLPPLSATRQAHPRPPVPSFLPPPPSALEQVGSLAGDLEIDLEVVDFSDMGKFLGVPEPSEPAPPEQNSSSNTSAFPSRPVASDFFDEPTIRKELPFGNSNLATWRQNQLQSRGHPSVSGQQNEATLSSNNNVSHNDAPDGMSQASDIVSSPSTKDRSPPSEQNYQTVLVPAHTGHQRTPRTGSFYKEATMSALDDAMSRIKGALDGMQASEQSKDTSRLSLPEANFSTSRSTLPQSIPVQKERWVPPALRSRQFDYETREVFQVTGIEPPRSPKPAWNAFVINLPSASQALEPVNNKQLQLSLKPLQARWDILSFEPPVEGMSRRDFSLNDVLFRKQPGSYRGKSKFRVMLPRLRPYALGPRVNIPVNPPSLKVNGGGAFGRPTAADGVTTWRKAALPKPESGDIAGSPHGLDTMSRSPPPDTLSLDPNSSATTNSSPFSKTEESTPVRSRLQPKMPAGSAVAFYRDSRIDAVEEDPKPSVNFIVTSELEESRQASQQASQTQPNITVTSPPNAQTSGNDHTNGIVYNGIVASTSAEITSPALSKSSDDSLDRRPITPPNHIAAPWARTSLSMPLKESPARGPDPEHLKAVWSQTSNKAGLHTTNSLEGIADDLTALPFTLQDVKSEDGETPPPTVPSAPSRMSAHDVTRAFQTVPASSSSTTTTYPSHRTPPIVAPPATRPSNYAYGLPHPPNAIRPTYTAYPSPMMSHSPGPGVMYPHPMTTSPIPSRMQVNGHTPLYSQPMWMSMGGPAPQNQANMMRPMTSPYPAQLMPYPHPGTPMYTTQPLPTMQSPSQQQNGAQLNRSRSVSMMSPVIPHAQMYGSPVLMHAPVMQVPQTHSYMPVPASRGQARAENGHMPVQQHSQPSNHQPSSHPTYNPVPSSSFVRSTW